MECIGLHAIGCQSNNLRQKNSMEVQLLVLITTLVVISGIFITFYSAPNSTTRIATIVAIDVISEPTTRSSVINMTIIQGGVAYIVLQSNLPCFTQDNCTFSVSTPFSLSKAPGEDIEIPTRYYIFSNGPVSYLNPGLRASFGGNMLLWIKAPDTNFVGSLTITIK